MNSNNRVFVSVLVYIENISLTGIRIMQQLESSVLLVRQWCQSPPVTGGELAFLNRDQA